MKTRALLAALLACLPLPLGADIIFERPVVIPPPASVAGVQHPAVSLNGVWKFSMQPPPNFHDNAVDPANWPDIEVPGEPWMQGFPIEFDTEYPYKRRIEIPAEFAGKRVFVRFDGVYSTARVWVNGSLVGSHSGGFTSWQVEITGQVTPGESAWLTVGITDDRDDLSFGSGYAGRYLGVTNVPHRIGGILRDVTLFALPQTHLTRLHAATDLDAEYENAVLKLEIAADFAAATAAEVGFLLTAPDGSAVPLAPATVSLSATQPAATVEIPVAAPLKWDAEHPRLYTLEARLRVDGQVVQSLTRRIGFREVEMAGNRMLVNGREVKLRGGCRHSIHPLAGRADVAGLDETDIRLYKEANINHIRTSHYPTTPRFLELCDEYGIYVEEEAAIVWVDHHAAQGVLAGRAGDPQYRDAFVAAATEMIERDMSHPSVVIWSIGNENITWGPNFEAERDAARALDPTRPLKTGHNHYNPGWNTDAYLDIDSYHYPTWNSNFNKTGKPYLFDEYAHVMCYYGPDSIPDLDPNIRNFWGESLKRFWDAMFPASGTLGGSIWGTVDEVFYTPDAAIGYGRWGIFDGWRRPKPEYWLTRKAYSPIRIANQPLGNPGPGQALRIPVKNWFDHTDFRELEIIWRVGTESGTLAASLPPHADGELFVPAREWSDGDVVRLEFTANQPGGFNYRVDEFELPLTARRVDFPPPAGPAPSLAETADKITVAGDGFELVFNKAAGQIESATRGGELLLTGGPVLNLAPYQPEPFTIAAISARIQAPFAVIDIAGSHGDIGVVYQLSVDGAGLIEADYTVTRPPADASRYAEVGVAFRLAGAVDRLDWDRKGLHSVYPADHIGRNQGSAPRRRPGPEQAYRQRPDWPWALDMKDFHQHGIAHAGYGMTQDFRGAKEYVFAAAAVAAGSGRQVRVESDGASHAVRIGLAAETVPVIDDRDPSVTYQGSWFPYADANDYAGTEMFSNQPGAVAAYAFTGTSVRWISARNHNLGKVDVFLDGERAAAAVDAYAPSKQHQQVLFERQGLANGPHTLRVVVRGDSNPAATNHYALIDGFSAVPPPLPANPDLMLHINRHWAYDLGWGNYNRSSQIQSGFSDTVRLRLLEGTPRATGRIPLDLRRPYPAAAPGRCELLWPSEHGAFYRVDWSADLTDWHALASFLPAADSTASFTIDLGTRLGFVPPAAFFRVTRQD